MLKGHMADIFQTLAGMSDLKKQDTTVLPYGGKCITINAALYQKM